MGLLRLSLMVYNLSWLSIDSASRGATATSDIVVLTEVHGKLVWIGVTVEFDEASGAIAYVDTNFEVEFFTRSVGDFAM